MPSTPGAGWWKAATALSAGLLFALLLALLAPDRVVLPVAARVSGVPVSLSGVHGIEQQHGRLIRWTTGRARLRWAGRFGFEPKSIVLSLAGFPGRHPDQLEVRVNGHVTRHAVPAGFETVHVPVPATVRAPVDIEIASLTSRPIGDGRDLGVRLESVIIESRSVSHTMAAVFGVQGLGVMVLGTLAWWSGAWAVGATSTSRSRMLWASVAWGVALLSVGAVAPTALRADMGLVLPPVLLGAVTTALLARAQHLRVVSVLAGLTVALQAMVCITWFAAAFVDVPRWDIWDLVPLIVKQETVGLTFQDLWASHNEHRPTIGRVVLLANVALSRWNHWNELWLMLGLTAAHYLVFVVAMRRVGRTRPIETLVALAGVGTFIATATQWENFLQGWQVALIAGALMMSTAFVVLTGGIVTWARLGWAAALVVIGTGGFASCLLAWPLGAAAIVLRRGPGWLIKAGAWLAFGLVVGLAYAHGLVRPAALPPPAPIFTSFTALTQVVYGTCMALGMPVWYAPLAFSDTQSLAWWLLPTLGALASTLAAALLAVHVFHAETRRALHWLLPALLVVFGIAACGVTAVGRVPLGMHAMTASRYIAFTSLFWVGLIWLLTVASPFPPGRARRGGLIIAALIVVAGLRGWVDSAPYIEDHFISGSLGRDALLREDWPNTGAIFPVAPVLDERRQVLKRRQLSLYRPGAR